MEAASREPGDLNARNGNPSARNGTEAPGGRLSAARSGRLDRLEEKSCVSTSCGPARHWLLSSPHAVARHRRAKRVPPVPAPTPARLTTRTWWSNIDGQALMDQSGVEFHTQTFSFGKAVCQIDNEPAQYNECFPKNQPTWWTLIEVGGAWTCAQTGFTAVTLHDKDAIGWRYILTADPCPPPPPLAQES